MPSPDTLRDIVLDILADGEDVSDGDADGFTHAWRVHGVHLERLCRAAGFPGGIEEALRAIEDEADPNAAELRRLDHERSHLEHERGGLTLYGREDAAGTEARLGEIAARLAAIDAQRRRIVNG